MSKKPAKKPKIKETDLYHPVKTFLERQGYDVKGEIGAVDVMAVRGNEAPVIVELKTGISLSLFHQAIERQAITDFVYVAVPFNSGRAFYTSLKRNTSLCRRLGLGMITVRLKDELVQVHCDPGPYAPRKSKPKTARLLKEFAKRVGDPNKGGAMRQGLITAYRQDALRCALTLSKTGPLKAALVAKESGVEKARQIMADDHYGWFEKISTGIYVITPDGISALKGYKSEITAIKKADKLSANSG
jgi:hypothetical protein